MYLNRSIFCLLFTIIFSSCGTQKNLNQKSGDERMVAQEKSTHSLIFPDDWMGYWKGNLKIYKENKLAQTIPMALDHGFTDTVGYHKWAIIYGPDSIAGRRNYFLKTIDADKGHYQTDERNSIFLDAYLFDNQLISTYEVGKYIIQSTYTLDGDKLHFEIEAIGTNPISLTGDQIINGDTIPEVKSYPVHTKQKATLKKIR